MKRSYVFAGAALLGAVLIQPSYADSQADNGPSALSLIKKADDYVGIQSKDKVVEIESDKSFGTGRPSIWRIDFYDPDAVTKCVEVKFGGGQKMDVSHPIRGAAFIKGDGTQILDLSKIKIDSDKALDIAMGQPLLKPVTLKASKLALTNGDLGPAWRVDLWAQKVNNPEHDANIGYVIISATDGSIVKLDLYPDRVN